MVKITEDVKKKEERRQKCNISDIRWQETVQHVKINKKKNFEKYLSKLIWSLKLYRINPVSLVITGIWEHGLNTS